MEYNIKLGDEQNMPKQSYGSSAPADPFGNNIEKPPEQELNPDQQQQQAQSAPTEQKDLGFCGFLQVEYYLPYFNITQDQVLERLKSSLFPIKSAFFEKSRNNPDLWGPFWICTTIIFMVAVSGNFAAYLSIDDKTKYFIKYKYVPVAAGLIYGVGFGTPILLAILMKCFGTDITIFQTICLYGYSMACFIPAITLCIIPQDWLQWILLIYAVVNSSAFLIYNLFSEFARYQEQKKYILYGIIIGFQVALLLMFKIYFFQLMEEDAKQSNL